MESPSGRHAGATHPEASSRAVPESRDDYMSAVTVGPRRRVDGPIVLADYDPAWPILYEREAARIRDALGDRVLLLEHVGSTSVPGLPAKPIVDIVLAVADSADEGAYVPPMEAAGYSVRIREPDWHEHRVFKGPDTDINLHTFTVGSPEIVRMLAFRDRLRTNADERDMYLRTKRELAARHWTYVQDYADAKGEVVEAIIARALAGGVDPAAR
jgi:GrpB-like predicted nucleotidyltransferase (UPF0157 family)